MDSPASKSIIAPFLAPLTPIATSVHRRGALTAPVRCLLCDIYGTLYISGCGDVGIAKRQHQPKELIAQLLNQHNLSIDPQKLLQQLYHAIDEHHQQSMAKGVAYPEVRIEKIWKTILPIDDDTKVREFAMAFEMIVNPVWPMPYLEQLIKTCRLNRIRLGIISNAQFYTPYLFEWFLGQNLDELGFDETLTFFSYAWGHAKPSPLLFETALQRLERMGISARQTVYIGNDMRKDIIPAKKVGFQAVLFAGDARSLRMDKDLFDDGSHVPDLVVTDLQQLIECLI